MLRAGEAALIHKLCWLLDCCGFKASFSILLMVAWINMKWLTRNRALITERCPRIGSMVPGTRLPVKFIVGERWVKLSCANGGDRREESTQRSYGPHDFWRPNSYFLDVLYWLASIFLWEHFVSGRILSVQGWRWNALRQTELQNN